MSACSRRNMIQAATAGLAYAACPVEASNSQISQEKFSPKFCLNTATIRGQNLPLDKQFKLAKQAGYDGIEPWLGDMEKFHESGNSLQDLGKWAQDNHLSVEGCIGFPEWLSNDPNKRKIALERLKKDLEKLVALGCKRIAAPPAGATQEKNIPLAEAAARFNPLAKLCLKAKITPLVEIWGFSSALNRLGDALYIASECGESGVSILADVYHLRKGGSGLTGLNIMGHHSLQIFHVNDYPARIAPKELNDADRIFPGDGSAPWMEIRTTFASTSPNCVLSLELFNRDVWKMDPAEALKIGLEKMKSALSTRN